MIAIGNRFVRRDANCEDAWLEKTQQFIFGNSSAAVTYGQMKTHHPETKPEGDVLSHLLSDKFTFGCVRLAFSFQPPAT